MRILLLLVVLGLILFILWLVSVPLLRPRQSAARPPADEFDRELFAQYNQLKRQANAAYLEQSEGVRRSAVEASQGSARQDPVVRPLGPTDPGG